MVIDVHWRKLWGRAFHNVGPATLKGLSLIVRSLKVGMERRCASEERSEWGDM